MLQLVWGVHTCHAPRVEETESMIQNAMTITMESGIAQISDKIVLVAGLPLSSPNMINTIRVIILGTVLTRADGGGFANPDLTYTIGKIVHGPTPQDAMKRITPHSNEILVCKNLTEEYISSILVVKGVICEGISEISEERLRAVNPNLVWLTNSRSAISKLEPGITVTLDAAQLLVYEGSVFGK